MDPAAVAPLAARIRLRQLLMALGDSLVEVQAAPAGLDVEIREVSLLDPEDPPTAQPGELVLVIGARGRAALPALRAAARDGAAAVVVKLDGPGQAAALSETAAEAGVALLSLRSEARWEQVHALARAALDDAPPGETGMGAEEGDLFSLAQTTAILTSGIVSIEDAANRVLAYSRTTDSDEADDLRRRSILGWQGPEGYLAKLREWGVFQHLHSSDEVIGIDSHPELGIRRRLAVAIRSGDRQLGTIWVQEGSIPLSERSRQALLGAARVAALHLVRRRRELSDEVTLTRTLLAGLLDGSTGPQPLATHLGFDATRPAAVLGFSYGTAEAYGTSEAGETAEGVAVPELTHSEVTNLVSVHIAARHRSALVTQVDSRVYVLLPQLPRGIDTDTLRGWTQEITDAALRHLGLPLSGSVGCLVPTLGDVPESRREADRILDAMASAGVTVAVAALPDIQAEVLVSEILRLLSARPEIRDPRLTALVSHDSRHQGRLAETLLTYLNSFGDIRAAAAQLHVHPNTLRYRLRRTEELTGLDLSRPDQRLLAMLQLRLPPSG
ncbi:MULTISPECIES: PucR family transcriptional regulator [Streptomyces]|uniref:Purine catabolism regulatory protein n=1 Tax=Streptomyces chartreusis NRRL 3882 TaxID=1079985 RepID=A0A2N9B9Q2_STRCX|nr:MULTISPECIES: helix-turn-helix domain-containing protein [Streptomyces]MYS93836.1 PucR family transcriptional regulator [Streptomyces sp. SID5464]SOR80100.1 Purine catabolism regulatory protein [Streptomyces chartreusis NRRL 3882]